MGDANVQVEQAPDLAGGERDELLLFGVLLIIQYGLRQRSRTVDEA